MNELKREISSFGLLFMSFTAIFGSGWLFAPFFAAQIAGSGALVAWVIGAFMSCIIGITMAEVIIMYPRAGGLNTVAQITHGKLTSFLVNMLMLIVCIVLPVLEVRAIVQYLSSHSHVLMTSDGIITLPGYLFAAFLLLIISWINIYGAKLVARVNSVSVVFKLVSPIVICLFFIITLYQEGNLNNANLHPFTINWGDIFSAISTSGIIFSFNGFNQATLFAAEAKHPSKSIPFAILGSILFAAVLYLLIQYVFLITVPASLITNGWNTLKYAGDSGPFSGMAVLLGLHWLLYFIYADAIVSPLGTAFTYSSGAPRIIYATAENGNVMSILQKLNKNAIPVNAVILTICLEFIAFVLLPNLKAMISILVAAFVLNYTVAPISLLSLRKSMPHLSRPFKIPFAPLLCFLSLFFSNIMAYHCGFVSLKNLVILVLILCTFGCTLLIRTKEELWVSFKRSSWFIVQLLMLTIIAGLQELKIISLHQSILIIASSCLFITLFHCFIELKISSLAKNLPDLTGAP